MTRLAFFILVILSSTINGQEFSKSDFKKTAWFASNKNGEFLKKDTIQFIKHSNKALKYEYIKYKENELVYLGHGDFVELEFKGGKKLKFQERINNYITVLDFKKNMWKFDKTNSTILIYKEGELMMELKPIKSREIEIKSQLARDKRLLKTTELTLIRIK